MAGKVIQSYPYTQVAGEEQDSVYYTEKGMEWQPMRAHYPTLWTRLRLLFIGIVMVFLFVLWAYQSPDEYPVPDVKRPFGRFDHKPMRTLGSKLLCDDDVLAPSKTNPVNVNAVRPADIKVLGSLGDSITVAAGSKNFDDEPRDLYIGNSYSIGGDESLDSLATLGNILKQVSPNLHGLSHGSGESERGFNVAVGGMTCEDLPRQATELVYKVKENSEVDTEKDWKLVTIFIGTNDIGNLSCYKNRPYVNYSTYKANLETAISILQKGLPRTIVTILAIWNSQLTIEANSLIFDGKRKSCGNGSIEQRDSVINDYRRASYELQNEKKFETDTFTVVTQSFFDDIKDSFRNTAGRYDTSFYADDVFHLSKYGNAIVGKNFWNNLLEPVGKKTTKAELNNDAVSLKCPDKNAPFIRTLGNS